MDKQIIIDGVDVSGCTYYDANADKEGAFLFDCKREHAPCWSCASMPGCLYKKYKRKEQECERLKEENAEIRKYQYEQDFLQEQLDQLNAEQNIIKAVCENHFDEYEMGCLNLSEAIESLLERYDNAITGLMKDRKELKTENETYKKMIDDKEVQLALTEIRSGERHLWFNKAEKYKQIIIEIKEIAEPFCNACQEFEPEKNCSNCIYCDYSNILQKISECEGEND